MSFNLSTVKSRVNKKQPEKSSSLEDTFPIGEVSCLARRESWRKEIYRPIYHIHKWWAQRLGSVFRAITLAALSKPGTDIWAEFYKQHNFKDKVVLDPFMGSGTTLGEAAKLGAKPIGVDINPVSTFIVSQSLTRVNIEELDRTFRKLEAEVAADIRQYYITIDPISNTKIPVLYYFWVKVVTTPRGETIPLFSSYVFSKDAYPKRKPLSKIICPACWHINTDRYDSTDLQCSDCQNTFNPQHGPVEGQFVIDSEGTKHKIKDLLEASSAPEHKLYALMAMRGDGGKIYKEPTEYDHSLYASASERLSIESLPLPDLQIRRGHNTDQAINYNYRNWRDFFNDRQLLCLGLLLRTILGIEDKETRNQFICLFSSTLEFNNLFCSFKGEGTGAVRHMFSHHILKPERTVLENSVWGAEKGSGTFSSLYRSRLLKAKQYLHRPFEVNGKEDGDAPSDNKVVSSREIDLRIETVWDDFAAKSNGALVLNGDSGQIPIPNRSVDAVITDPPYFDFIHYSELSDFFFAWLSPVLRREYSYFEAEDSSHNFEVQSRDPERFSEKLGRVFRECHRVLKDDGLLTFSFHHSRPDGWLSIYTAIDMAGFEIVATHPIYGEMKGASPKQATKEPITLDAILVCKKRNLTILEWPISLEEIQVECDKMSDELEAAGFALSRADKFVIMMSQLLVAGSKYNYRPSRMSELLNLIPNPR